MCQRSHIPWHLPRAIAHAAAECVVGCALASFSGFLKTATLEDAPSSSDCRRSLPFNFVWHPAGASTWPSARSRSLPRLPSSIPTSIARAAELLHRHSGATWRRHHRRLRLLPRAPTNQPAYNEPVCYSLDRGSAGSWEPERLKAGEHVRPTLPLLAGAKICVAHCQSLGSRPRYFSGSRRGGCGRWAYVA
jgi:hypothetical protein